VPIFRI